jgi:hypothetical protein
MSLFEWFGESRNPGPIGEIDHGTPPPTVTSPPDLHARGVMGGILLLGGAYVASLADNRVLGFGLLVVYLALAYFVNARPDYSNVGWLGGMMDHPFRWSDDVNRHLAFLKVVLWPGRFAVVSVRDLFARARGRHYIVLERTDE